MAKTHRDKMKLGDGGLECYDLSQVGCSCSGDVTTLAICPRIAFSK